MCNSNVSNDYYLAIAILRSIQRNNERYREWVHEREQRKAESASSACFCLSEANWLTQGECEGPFYRPQVSPPPLADSNHTKSRQSLLAPGHCVLSYFLILSLPALWYSVTVILTRARGRVVVNLSRSLQMSLFIWRGRQHHKRLSERPTAAPVDLKIYQEWWALFHIMTSIKNISALY